MATSVGTSTSGADPLLQGQYNTEYNNALQFNDQNYSNIQSAYAQQQAGIASTAAGVASGYGALSQQVLQTIAGIGQSQSQAITDTYAQQAGALGQQLINSGLGNTTVSGSMQRGVTLDAQKAQIALANQIAGLTAGYQAQLGGAGLQAQLQGASLQSQNAGNFMHSSASSRLPMPSWPPNASRSQNSSMSPNGSTGGSKGGNQGILRPDATGQDTPYNFNTPTGVGGTFGSLYKTTPFGDPPGGQKSPYLNIGDAYSDMGGSNNSYLNLEGQDSTAMGSQQGTQQGLQSGPSSPYEPMGPPEQSYGLESGGGGNPANNMYQGGAPTPAPQEESAPVQPQGDGEPEEDYSYGGGY